MPGKSEPYASLRPAADGQTGSGMPQLLGTERCCLQKTAAVIINIII